MFSKNKARIPRNIPNNNTGNIILKLLIPAAFIEIISESLFNLIYVIKEAKNPIKGIIVASNLGIIKIVKFINISRGKPFITIRSINLSDCVNHTIPVIAIIIRKNGPINCLNIYKINKFNF